MSFLTAATASAREGGPVPFFEGSGVELDRRTEGSAGDLVRQFGVSVDVRHGFFSRTSRGEQFASTAADILRDAAGANHGFKDIYQHGHENLEFYIEAMNFGDPTLTQAILDLDRKLVARGQKVGRITVLLHGPTSFRLKGRKAKSARLEDLEFAQSPSGQAMRRLRDAGFGFNEHCEAGPCARLVAFSPVARSRGPGRLMHQKGVLVVVKEASAPATGLGALGGMLNSLQNLTSKSYGLEFARAQDGSRIAGFHFIPSDNFSERSAGEPVVNTSRVVTDPALILAARTRALAISDTFSAGREVSEVPWSVPLTLSFADDSFFQRAYTDGKLESPNHPNHRIAQFLEYAAAHPDEVQVRNVTLGQFNVTYDRAVVALHSVLRAHPEATMTLVTDKTFVNPASALASTFVGIPAVGDQGVIEGRFYGDRVRALAFRADSANKTNGKMLFHLKTTVIRFAWKGRERILIFDGSMNLSDRSDNLELQDALLTDDRDPVARQYERLIPDLVATYPELFMPLDRAVMLSLVADLLGVQLAAIGRAEMDRMFSAFERNDYPAVARVLRDILARATADDDLRVDELETSDGQIRSVRHITGKEVELRLRVIDGYFDWLAANFEKEKSLLRQVVVEQLLGYRQQMVHLGQFAALVHLIETARDPGRREGGSEMGMEPDEIRRLLELSFGADQGRRDWLDSFTNKILPLLEATTAGRDGAAGAGWIQRLLGWASGAQSDPEPDKPCKRRLKVQSAKRARRA